MTAPIRLYPDPASLGPPHDSEHEPCPDICDRLRRLYGMPSAAELRRRRLEYAMTDTLTVYDHEPTPVRLLRWRNQREMCAEVPNEALRDTLLAICDEEIARLQEAAPCGTG